MNHNFNPPTKETKTKQTNKTTTKKPQTNKTRCVMKHKCPRTRHHRQNPRSRFQNLRLEYKGLVTSNMHMKYKRPITYHSNDMAKVKVFKEWVKFKVKVKNYGTIRKFLS
jgi:hypothetical protein